MPREHYPLRCRGGALSLATVFFNVKTHDSGHLATAGSEQDEERRGKQLCPGQNCLNLRLADQPKAVYCVLGATFSLQVIFKMFLLGVQCFQAWGVGLGPLARMSSCCGLDVFSNKTPATKNTNTTQRCQMRKKADAQKHVGRKKSEC